MPRDRRSAWQRPSRGSAGRRAPRRAGGCADCPRSFSSVFEFVRCGESVLAIQYTSSRNRIVSVPSPGMAAHYTLKGEPSTLDRAIFPQRLHRIFGTGRGIAAGGRQYPRRPPLPQPGDKDQDVLHACFCRRVPWPLPFVPFGRRGLRGSPLPAAARSSAMPSSSRSLAKSRSIPVSRPMITWSWSGRP